MPSNYIRKTVDRDYLPMLVIGPSIAYVPLTKGLWSCIESDDIEWASQYKWCATWNPSSEEWYALRAIKVGKKTTNFRMHRELLGIVAGDKRQGDHKNHNTLDNRRQGNLRMCSASQNQHNTRGQSNSRSGHKGVFFDSHKGKWVAKIMVNGKKHHLGYGSTPEECSTLYQEAAIRLHGEFACLETNSLTPCATMIS